MDFSISSSRPKRVNDDQQRNLSQSSTSTGSENESDALRATKKRNELVQQENEVLHRAASHLSQANLPGMMYSLVRVLAANGIPIAVTSRGLKIARQLLPLARGPSRRRTARSLPGQRVFRRPVPELEVVEVTFGKKRR